MKQEDAMILVFVAGTSTCLGHIGLTGENDNAGTPLYGFFPSGGSATIKGRSDESVMNQLKKILGSVVAFDCD